MTTTFETAKVGDRVWSLRSGWGVIASTGDSLNFPILVEFSGTNESFTVDGRPSLSLPQLLFWDEVVIEAPTKPLPDLPVDTKVVVWGGNASPKTKRYFSHFSPSGDIMCFVNGMTSWTTEHTSPWKNWELAE